MTKKLSNLTGGVAACAVLWIAATPATRAIGLPAEPPSEGARARESTPLRSTPAATAAFERCEEAVGRAIREMHGPAAQALRFEPGSRAQDVEGARRSIRGAGRYLRGGHDPVSFRYSCAYDDETGTTSGVLFHESDDTPPPALPVWHADVSRLALDACETEAAARLQAVHPRASGIAFDGDDRRLSPGADGGTDLDGGGRYAPAAGVAPGAFHYRCDFDASGRLRSAHAE